MLKNKQNEFKHIIITRFNLRMGKGYEYDKNKNLTGSEEWLEKRFILFNKYCFPSLKAQLNKNFIWFVLFDSETPDRYKLRIKEYELLFSNFIPIFWVLLIIRKLKKL